MDISVIAMNRIVEDSIREGIITLKDLKRKGRTVLSQVRKLDDETIIHKLVRLLLDFSWK